ncbi:MAG TPA: fimbria/pilus periplasmic chaperone [Rhodanobacteraceae bacterium]|jgi:chaperone protein EcpD|nr:fimbria/pilus periplasmic chaperone [Rhodanobacteraceae bacterium]
MNILTRALGAAAVALCLAAPAANASVVISGTRVVFNAAQGEATVRLTNDNTQPALVEAWIDDGDINSTPDTVHTPFLITPPLFRMNAHKDQNLRILYIQGAKPLPTNRESVFWLNVLEIPPKPTGPQFAGKNYLQFAIRTRIKLFYRPAKLQGDVLKAPDQLTFKTVAEQGVALEVHNPTPYYITINSLSLGADTAPVKGADGMVAPYGNLKLPLQGVAHAPMAGTPIVFSTINDYGAGDSHRGVIAQ